MHPAAHSYAAKFASSDKLVVVDVGSKDINGTVRGLFPNARYTGIDIVDGKAVDVVVDAVEYVAKPKADLVVCLEMLEHCGDWDQVLENIHTNMLKSGGRIVVTAAGLSRAPHSGVDGGQVRDDEFYENVDPEMLEIVMVACGFVDVEVNTVGDDVQATGVKD